MRDLSHTYVHRGDAERLRHRVKRLAGLSAGAAVLAAAMAFYPSPSTEVARAAVIGGAAASSSPLSDNVLRSQLLGTQGQLEAMTARLNRATRIIEYSSRYAVSADLAARVFDAANGESIDPELAFRLVKLESDFDPHAQSAAGALGLTQLMPSTARYYQKGLRDAQLFDPDLNLHIGFRYLHSLIEQYHGNVGLALLVYNRGEAAVESARAEGRNPTNGYERILMKGYTGPGIID